MKRLSVTVAALGAALAATDTSLAQGWVQLTAPSNNIGPIACSADGSKLLLAGGYWFTDGGGGPLHLARFRRHVDGRHRADRRLVRSGLLGARGPS